MAVATWWRLSGGGAAAETMPASTRLEGTALCPGRPRSRRATRLRLVSVFRQGWVERLVALLRQESLPQGRFVPDPWPAVPALEDEACEPVMALPEVGGGSGEQQGRCLGNKRMHSQHLMKNLPLKAGEYPTVASLSCPSCVAQVRFWCRRPLPQLQTPRSISDSPGC